MIKSITKRDGRTVVFDKKKIADAIFKVINFKNNLSYDLAQKLSEKIIKYMEHNINSETISAEYIQNVVEKILNEEGYAQSAKEYALYRSDRTRIREMNTKLMKIYKDLMFKPAKDNDIKRENANIDGDTTMGTMLKYGSEGAKQFNEMFILEPRFAKAHADGDIHIHDLDFLTLATNCCQIDLDRLFTKGFSTGHGFLREPNDILSYAALGCIAIQANQNDQFGGQSVPNFDYAMAKGVAKTYTKLYKKNVIKALEILTDTPLEELSSLCELIFEKAQNDTNNRASLEDGQIYEQRENELLSKIFSEEIVDKAQKFAKLHAKTETDRSTYQAMEALIHNLNTMHSRAGAQVPFSSINYGTDATPEGRLVIKNILLATDAGLGNGETPIFPIHIFKVKEGINYNPGDPNYDLFKLACKVSAKRLFPNFSFIDAPFNLKYYKPGKPDTEIAYMGCRTRVIANHYDPSREIVNGRGNLSFTSINLPRLAIRSHNDINLFFKLLDEKINLVIDQLLARFELQARKKVRNYPFLMGQGVWLDSEKLNLDDEVREVLKHGTLTIGFIGLAECLKALVGKHHGESEESQKLGIKIISHMRDKTSEATAKYNMNFSLIATPAEGLSGRFVKLDAKRFGKIPGVTDRNYYTNSFHVPVYYNISAWNKIQKEAPYHALTDGGHISYVELDGDPTKNLDAFEQIIRCMKESGIGYGSINHPVDRDPICGYTGIIDDTCPQCGRKESSNSAKFERIRRITGYLVGTIDRFNNAKRDEEKDRVKHSTAEDMT